MGNVTTGSPHPIAKPVRAPTSFPRAAVVIVALAAALVGSLALKQFAWPAAMLPGYAADAAGLVQALSVRLGALGVGASQVQAVSAALDLRRVITAVAALFRGLISFGATMIFFLGLLLFRAIDSVGIDSRLEMLSAKRPGLSNALRIFARDTRRFLAVTGIFGLLTGFADTLLLWWLGIPLAVLWGLLTAVCNFIPYVGLSLGSYRQRCSRCLIRGGTRCCW
jgi:AI-2 transport protein TqsA